METALLPHLYLRHFSGLGGKGLISEGMISRPAPASAGSPVTPNHLSPALLSLPCLTRFWGGARGAASLYQREVWVNIPAWKRHVHQGDVLDLTLGMFLIRGEEN